jgi:hypothetical protein
MSSEPFDVLLCDPSEGELRAAIEGAFARAGVDCYNGNAAFWRRNLDRFFAEPEAWWYAVGRSAAFIAWWTDNLGHKHTRVRVGEYDTDAPPGMGGTVAPLWHVFPDRVYRVDKPGQESRWLVSCACGETGVPQQLGWMGQRCAACHDRREEGQPHPDDDRPVTFAEPERGHVVAIAPDGQSLAVSSGCKYLRLVRLRDGARQVLSERDDDGSFPQDRAWQPLAFSPDGRWLAGWDQGFLTINFWDLHRPEAEPESTALRLGEVLTHLAFSPDGRFFARCNDRGNFDLSLAEGGWFEPEKGTVPDSAQLFAFRPDGKQLAVAWGDGVELYDTESWGRPRSRKCPKDAGEHWLFMQYSPHGKRLVLLSGESSPVPRLRQLYLLPLEGRKKARTARLPEGLSRAALSPDGRCLGCVASTREGLRGEVFLWDVENWQEAGRLRGDLVDGLRDLAFSPDGQKLATISRGGVVKLWPWRLLLQAIQ